MLALQAARCKRDMTRFMRNAWLPKAIGFRHRPLLGRCMSTHIPIIRISPAFCPVLSVTIKQASNSSTDQGGGKRRAAIRLRIFGLGPSAPSAPRPQESAVVKREPRSCNWATSRTRKMPRFSTSKPSAAAQRARSCESDKASMPPWSCRGDRCQPPDLDQSLGFGFAADHCRTERQCCSTMSW